MSSTICPYPFAHTDIEPNGEIKYCCAAISGEHTDANGDVYNIATHTLTEAWNSDRLQSLRQSLIVGEKPEACRVCWEQEAAAGNSLRLKTLNRIPVESIQDRITEAKENNGRLSKLAFDFQVSSGNLCNLACKMCNPAFSTNFGKFFKRFVDTPQELTFVPGIIPPLNHDTDFNTVFDWPVSIGLERVFADHYNSIRSLFITGGEPTLVKENIDFLERLVELGYSQQIKVWPSTNCTNINRRLLDTLSKYQTIELNLSLDGMDEIAYIQRTPSDWPSIESNVDLLMAWQLEQQLLGKSVKVNVITTLTSLNFHHVMDFWRYLVKRYPKNRFSIAEPNLVWHADINFGIASVPQSVADQVADNLDCDFTGSDYEKIRFAHSYMKELTRSSKFADDYAIIHFCLDQVQRFHPDLDVKKIYSIYY
jgi:MoaA/NifB/PqqE/SkfB family radical SAM enzyme